MNDAKYDYEIDEDDINTAYNEAMDKKRFKILMNAAAYFRQGFELDENSPEAKVPIGIPDSNLRIYRAYCYQKSLDRDVIT